MLVCPPHCVSQIVFYSSDRRFDVVARVLQISEYYCSTSSPHQHLGPGSTARAGQQEAESVTSHDSRASRSRTAGRLQWKLI